MESTAVFAERAAVAELDLCCGGRTKCPKITLFSTGDLELRDGDAAVFLTAEQLARVEQWLREQRRGG